MTNPTVTVVLNGYKRPHTLKMQIQSLESQTVRPNETLLWKNSSKDVITELKFKFTRINATANAKSNQNFGVWARFAYSLLAKSEFVCVLDDDTIPGSRWLENCLESFAKQPGLYGTIGVRFNSTDGYDGSQVRVGWDMPNNQIEKVDIVGHSWFFPKSYLSYFWREFPEIIPTSAGEDIHFSHMLQKHAGIDTFVPPHPKSDKQLWGSIPSLATKFGGDSNATAMFAIPQMNEYIRWCIEDGFRLMNDK